MTPQYHDYQNFLNLYEARDGRHLCGVQTTGIKLDQDCKYVVTVKYTLFHTIAKINQHIDIIETWLNDNQVEYIPLYLSMSFVICLFSDNDLARFKLRFHK